MGASGASSGGGGSGVPDQIRPAKVRRKEVIKETANKIFSKSPISRITKGLKKASKKSKQNVLDYEGQAAGVTPMRNPINQRDRESDNLPTVLTTPTIQPKPEPIVEVKNIGGRDVQVQAPTEAEMAQAETDKKEEYDVRRTKRRGRRMTILTPTGGVRGDFVLGKPTLLGS